MYKQRIRYRNFTTVAQYLYSAYLYISCDISVTMYLRYVSLTISYNQSRDVPHQAFNSSWWTSFRLAYRSTSSKVVHGYFVIYLYLCIDFNWHNVVADIAKIVC